MNQDQQENSVAETDEINSQIENVVQASSLELLEFSIKIKREMWDKLGPVKRTYADKRTYTVLESNWTHLIFLALYEEQKLPCPFSFKNQHFYKLPYYPYFSFYGFCPEENCSNLVCGYIIDKPAPDDDIYINIEVGNTRNKPHVKRRKLSGALRNEAKTFLIYMKPKKYKDTIAGNLLTDSGRGIELLHNSYIYQGARQQILDYKIGLNKYPGQLISSVLNIMNDYSSIRKFSISPLVLHYWSENQISLAKEAAGYGIPVSIDASGRFVKRVKIIGKNTSSSIFLYNVVIRIENKIYSLCQMLSDRHDVPNSSMWLFDWIQSGAPVPKEVVLDCSSALLNSVSFAFNGFFYEIYLNRCYDILKGGNSTLPSCYIRRDRNHLINTIGKWDSLTKNKDWRKRDYFLRCIAFSLNIETLNLLEQVIEAIFIIFKSSKQTDIFLEKKNLWIREYLHLIMTKILAESIV